MTTMYAKLNNGVLEYAPVNWSDGGKIIINFNKSSSRMMAYGFKPIVYLNSQSDVTDDTHDAKPTYEEAENAINCTFVAVEKQDESNSEGDELNLVISNVISLILRIAREYNAIDDIMAMDNINITSLMALIESKGVKVADKNDLSYNIVMLALDLQTRLNKTWYDIWKDIIKPAVVEALTKQAGQETETE